MGTNYYVRTPPCANACDHCAKVTEIHIGKSSAGWRFLHRAYRDDARPPGLDFAVTDHTSWLMMLDIGPIVDEYGDEHDRAEFIGFIDGKQNGIRHDGSDPRARAAGFRDDRSGDDFVNGGYDFYAREFC